MTYSAESIITDVGYLKTTEKLAVRNILGLGSDVTFDRVSRQVHLFWIVEADTLDDAIEAARRVLRIAKHATGVHVPHTSHFSVREIDR